MTESTARLPSNRRFGVFFASAFSAATLYFLLDDSPILALSCTMAAFLLFIITATNPDSLLLVNKTWMRLGVLLGAVVSPIVLGVFFFGVFAPIGVLTRLCGRDELRIRLKSRSSHWIKRDDSVNPESFRRQF